MVKVLILQLENILYYFKLNIILYFPFNILFFNIVANLLNLEDVR